MKKIILLFLIVGLTVSCTTTKKLSQAQGQNKTAITHVHDGSSYKNAIIIHEKTETNGVAAEYAWLRKHYPGYRFKEQAMVYDHRKPYDILTIVTNSGAQKEIYFDISAFFGKW